MLAVWSGTPKKKFCWNNKQTLSKWTTKGHNSHPTNKMFIIEQLRCRIYKMLFSTIFSDWTTSCHYWTRFLSFLTRCLSLWNKIFVIFELDICHYGTRWLSFLNIMFVTSQFDMFVSTKKISNLNNWLSILIVNLTNQLTTYLPISTSQKWTIYC